MIVKIFINPINYTLKRWYKKEEDEYLIGVDKGAYHALKNGLDLDLVLGDFDSVSEEEYAYIKKHAKQLETFKERKDYTDSDLALQEALKKDPEKIVVYGGVGRRLDHTYGNILFLKRGPIEFVTDHQWMKVFKPGVHHIDNPFDYVSFFALETVKNLTLKGFSFELEGYYLTPDDPLCISNQGSGAVSFDEGLLLAIAADD